MSRKATVLNFSEIMRTMFQPMKEWQEGYNTAKEHYSNWNKGFDDGYKSAEKLFKDYNKGFGDGFEAGWDSALDKGDEE